MSFSALLFMDKTPDVEESLPYLDRRSRNQNSIFFPPAFAIASPSLDLGEAMAEVGGRIPLVEPELSPILCSSPGTWQLFPRCLHRGRRRSAKSIQPFSQKATLSLTWSSRSGIGMRRGQTGCTRSWAGSWDARSRTAASLAWVPGSERSDGPEAILAVTECDLAGLLDHRGRVTGSEAQKAMSTRTPSMPRAWIIASAQAVLFGPSRVFTLRKCHASPFSTPLIFFGSMNSGGVL